MAKACRPIKAESVDGLHFVTVLEVGNGLSSVMVELPVSVDGGGGNGLQFAVDGLGFDLSVFVAFVDVVVLGTTFNAGGDRSRFADFGLTVFGAMLDDDDDGDDGLHFVTGLESSGGAAVASGFKVVDGGGRSQRKVGWCIDTGLLAMPRLKVSLWSPTADTVNAGEAFFSPRGVGERSKALSDIGTTSVDGDKMHDDGDDEEEEEESGLCTVLTY